MFANTALKLLPFLNEVCVDGFTQEDIIRRSFSLAESFHKIINDKKFEDFFVELRLPLNDTRKLCFDMLISQLLRNRNQINHSSDLSEYIFPAVDLVKNFYIISKEKETAFNKKIKEQQEKELQAQKELDDVLVPYSVDIRQAILESEESEALDTTPRTLKVRYEIKK